MSLTSALNSARNALSVRSAETDLVSRNVAGVNEAGYTQKRANISTNLPGAIRLISISRASDDVLFTGMTRAASDSAAQKALLAGLNQMQQIVDPALGDATLSSRMGALNAALTQSAGTPSDETLAQDTVDKANSLAQSLRDATSTIQAVRQGADADMVASVKSINDLLSQFQSTNMRIMQSQASQRDSTNDLDARDQILAKLGSEIGIRTLQRQNGDMQIFTDSGVTLFDGAPSNVTIDATTVFDPTTSGQPIMVDGLPVTGDHAIMKLQSGRLAGLARLRDESAPAYQRQMDEMARGLIQVFQETDTSGNASSARAGLFRDGTSTDLSGSSLSTGLAARLSVAATVDRRQGGNPFLLRDGGINAPGDPSYRLNINGAASWSDRLQILSSALNNDFDFDPANSVLTKGSLTRFAAVSTGWIEGQRQTASSEADQKSAVYDRAQQALSAATGVNLDTEMSKMLDLERAYQGSAKLISAVDSMLQSLLQAVG